MTGRSVRYLGIILSFSFAGGVLAQSEGIDGVDAARSLQIPPQDILKLAAQPGASPVAVSATRPASVTLAASSTRPAGDRVERRDPGSWSTVSALGSPSRESQVISRAGASERSNLPGTVRDNESKDVARRRATGVWSIRDLWPLLLVLALIAVLAWIVKRTLPGRQTLTSSGVLEVLSRTPLSGKQSLVLVRMGRRLLLLGVTGDQINTLAVIEDPDQVATLMGEAASGRPGSMTHAFARAVAEEGRAYLSEGSDDDAGEGEADAGGQVRSLLDKVRHLTARKNVA